jgi:hypothetical protein
MKTLKESKQLELSSNDLLVSLLKTKSAEELLKDMFNNDDVREAFVKTYKQDVTKSVTKWLFDEYEFTKSKVIYDNGKIIAEASKGETILDTTPKKGKKKVARSKRAPVSGFQKLNKGIFSTLREYIADELKKGVTVIPFDTFYKDMKSFFPDLTERNLSIYLNDERQIENVDFSKKRGTVILLTPEEIRKRRVSQ